MNKNTLEKILKFRGDIRSSFEFLMSVYNDLGFPMQTNLMAVSRPFDTFANSIRSYRQKAIIQPVEKSGVRLILTGRNLIQYLLVQRFLLAGGNLGNLQANIPLYTDENLQRLILTEKILLSDLPIKKLKKETRPKEYIVEKIGEDNTPVLHAIEVSSGLLLLFHENQYSISQAKRIGKVIKKTLRGMK